MIRISLASNNNRSLVKVAMVSQYADLKKLKAIVKDKLRIKGVQGFYRVDGTELEDSEELQEDLLILAHRGEAFVGKTRAEAPSPQREEWLSSWPALPAFERHWTPAMDVPALRVLSFNILAPCLAQGVANDVQADSEQEAEPTSRAASAKCGVYYAARAPGKQAMSHNFACGQSVLAWQRRLHQVQRELLQHNPDLLCLQEMDSTAWNSCQKFLIEQGYCKGVCSQGKGGVNNFVALFWREKRLRAVNDPEIVYLTAQGTITAIVQRLEVIHEGEGKDSETLVAVTTHLKAGLKLKDEQDRAKQVQDLLYVLEQFVREDEAIIFAGDCNSHLEDLHFFPGKDSALPGLVLPQLLKHGFRCAVHEATGKPLAFSQWCLRCDVEIRSVIDHIMIRGPSVVASAALESPDPSVISAAGALPNEMHPSDHIPVIADISLKRLQKATLATETSDSATILHGSSDSAVDLSAIAEIRSEKQLVEFARGLPGNGRVALTEDGFKYVALPKEWQAARCQLAAAAASAYSVCIPEQLAADRAALTRQLSYRQKSANNFNFSAPASCVGLHISLGKHADQLDVGRRVRFQIKRVLHFSSRKLGEPSSATGFCCARWFTYEVSLIDAVRCEGEEPHISFATFGAHS